MEHNEQRLMRRKVGNALALTFLVGMGVRFAVGNINPDARIPNPTLPSPNAFDDYAEAARLYEPDSKKADNDVFKIMDSRHVATQEEWTHAAAIVHAHQRVLATVRRGLAHAYFQPPSRSMNDQYPFLTQDRSLARLLVAEGKLKVWVGDNRGALNCYLDALHLGEQVSRGGSLIGFLSGRSIEAIAVRALEVATPTLSADDARYAAQRMIETENQHASAADALTEEKYVGQGTLMELFTNFKGFKKEDSTVDGKESGKANKAWQMSPLYIVWSKRTIMTNYSVYMDAQIACARQPYNVHAPTIPIPSDLFNRILDPVFTQFYFKERTGAAQRTLLTTGLALRAYQAEHEGASPTTLTDLVPRYLPTVPADPFAPAPRSIGYRNSLDCSTPFLYSVGPDGVDDNGDAIDNTQRLQRQGEPRAKELASRVLKESTGDIVAGINR